MHDLQKKENTSTGIESSTSFGAVNIKQVHYRRSYLLTVSEDGEIVAVGEHVLILHQHTRNAQSLQKTEKLPEVRHARRGAWKNIAYTVVLF